LRIQALLWIILARLAVCGICGEPAPLFQDAFDAPRLDTERWQLTRQGDVKESLIDIVDGRLRMRLDTMSTRDETVKYHGIRTKQAFSLTDGLEIAMDVDWNKQANGCYMTAGLYLSPVATEANPGGEKDWLKFEYVGVPPGQNARALLAVKVQGRERRVYTEGWPEQRKGRPIGLQKVRLVIRGNSLQIWENEQKLFETTELALPWPQVYLYLQMSSHSNYRAREVFFDNVCVRPPGDEAMKR